MDAKKKPVLKKKNPVHKSSKTSKKKHLLKKKAPATRRKKSPRIKRPKTQKETLQALHALSGPVEKYDAIIKAVKTGRPTKYRKEFCVKVIELAKQGMSLESIALRLGTFYPVMKKGTKKFKPFDIAIKKARAIAKDWWIETGRRNIYNNKFNNILWMMNMTNRFKWSRSDIRIEKNVHPGKIINDNRKIEVNITEQKAKTISQILEEAGALPKGASKRVAELVSAEVN